MKQLISLIALIVLIPLTIAGQGRTTDTIVEVPFSQLNPNARNGSVRVVINGSPTAPCTVGDQRVLAIKLGPVWNCSDFDFDSVVVDGAPTDATYITQTPSTSLTGEQALSALTTGLLKSTTGTGVVSIAVAGTDYLTPTSSGALLTSLNASQLASGTLPDARFPTTLPVLSGINLTALNASNLGSGIIPDARFPAVLPAASGVNLTALNASNLSSGTVPDARFPATLPTISGANLTGLNADNLAAGTLPDARFPAALPAISGVNLTGLNASNITGGTVAPARLGIGSGGTTKFLREDSSWQTIPGGGDALTSSPLSQFAATTSAQLAGVLTNETGSGVAVFSDNAVLVQPTIANFVNMGHDHTSATMGGQLTDAALSGVVGASKGGTGNAFFAVSGPAASIKTFTFPNASANVLTDAATITIGQGGTGQTTATAAFNALDPLTTKGDMLSHDGTNSVRLAVGTNGLCVKANSATATGLEWGTCGSGTGDVVGPVSATDNAVVRFDLTTGKLVQNSAVTIDDSGNITTTGTITSGSGSGEAGVLDLSEGTAPVLVANTFSVYAPVDVAAGGLAYVLPAAAASGVMRAANSSGVMTITHDAGISHLAASTSADLRGVLSDETGTGAAVFVAGNIGAGSATTAAANDNSTLISTTAYVQTELNAYAADTKTLTNTTLDVEATGNVFIDVHRTWLAFVGCNATTPGFLWDVPTTGAPTAACVTGTNTQKGTADWPDSDGDFHLQNSLLLPANWTGTIDARVRWYSTTATTGDVVWQIQTSCVADGETDDPAWNTASTVTDTAKGTVNQMNDATITGITVTGCAAGEMLHVLVQRNRTHASDTIAGIIRGVGLELTLRSSK